MFRVITAIAASLLLVLSQSGIPARAGELEGIKGGLQACIGVLRCGFLRLQSELQHHRDLAASGGWPRVPVGPTIEPGAEDPRLGILAGRLAISGDLPAESMARPHYDAGLQEAVQGFQARHGLTPDGLVGRATLSALNVSVEQRIDQIRVNLERRRLLFDANEENLVLVNIAAYEAKIIRDGHTVWTTKIIVGDPDDETPQLGSELQSVVFNPTWFVPHSIATEELLPKIKQDPHFFSKGGYVLRDREGNAVDPSAVDWSRIAQTTFPFRLLQRPGPQNQLGQVKFIVPNPFSVCLHDTPARSLFASTKRALSHGCIRVDEPLVLAELVLAAEGWTREQIDAQIRSGETKTVVLSNPLPVHVVYWTASVDESGRIHFYDDIYGRDAKILRTLNSNNDSDD